VKEIDPYVPTHFGQKLSVVAALGWLSAWLFVPWTFAVWALMLGVYIAVLAVTSLTQALAPELMAGHRDWVGSFVRTAGWMILSGIVSLTLYIAVLLVAQF
jgi:hypothetical protein